MKPLAVRNNSVLVVVDLQPTFLRPIASGERVVARTRFLAECARLLDVPIIATVQNAERMGRTESSVIDLLGEPIDKMSFSCCANEHFQDRLRALNRTQAILAGIETHICINQTAHHLLESGTDVFLAADAIGARLEDAHEIGLSRMVEAGAVLAHSESIVYEWLGSADDPQFREVLQIVKRYADAVTASLNRG